MVHLKFTLTPEASAQLHDALVCLARFNETVHIEARRDRLALTALNTSKSGYASVSLEKSTFFSSYEFVQGSRSGDDRFTCSILSKALLSVFTSRLLDPRSRDTVIDRCEAVVDDSFSQVECKFVIKLICSQGVTKTYKLNYEAVDVMHALFDKNTARNKWTIHSGRLKTLVDHFSPKTEQLDIYAENGRVMFTSFTEKIMDGNEILKQPLQTAVNISSGDFESFTAQEKMHIVISVRDFKAIVAHAHSLETSLTALYSQPSRPLQFCYGRDGMHCEFTLMTTGDARSTPAPSATRAGPGVHPEAASAAASADADQRNRNTAMPPPSMPTSRRLKQPGSARPVVSNSGSQDSRSLFVPPEEDERQWDPPQYQEEETLGWDASADNDIGMRPTVRDSGSFSQAAVHDRNEGFAPTQRVSQFKGIFD